MKDKKQLYKDINDTLDIFRKYSKYGLINGQIKEKYNTTRWYANLGSHFSLNDIFYPGHVYYRLPNFCRYIDHYFLTPVFGRLFSHYRTFWYRRAYHKVLTKYPNIYHCIDYPDLLNQQIYNKYISHQTYISKTED